MSLSLHQLHFSYIRTQQSDIWHRDIVFQEGAYYHIRAVSGKGKSSLVQAIYGLNKNYSGEIRYAGKQLRSMTPDQISNIRANEVSIVFQDLRLLTEFTAAENLELKRKLRDYTSAPDLERMAGELGIDHLLHRTINTLSYGERQRVAILRALLQPFELLLLDEPFSHLDNANIQKAAGLILKEVQKRGAALLITDLEKDQHFPYHFQLEL
jgi:putative ABC transport system ATP-binding protein